MMMNVLAVVGGGGRISSEVDITPLVNFFNEIVTLIRNVMTPVSVVALVICGAMWVFSSDQQSVTAAKKWMLRIILGLVIIWAGPTVLRSLITVLQGYGG